MTDGELDWRLREAAQAYNAPPETPREEMWVRIAAARPAHGALATPPELPVRRLRWWHSASLAAAAAAALVVGIGIGRVSVDANQPTWEGPSANAATYHLATQEHLSQSEAFLTLFRASLGERAAGERADQRLASASARQLLSTNRLLLDSPAAVDPQTRLLLEDLELVLAGIAQLSPRSQEEDLELIRDGIERGNVMPRLRTAVPAGAAPTQGVL
ncbi:MAG TPA: hypothetical protein VHG35_18680 [Gemmatimonadales bacterium]|nr:hypothetical protein [Gemmatimonadales bacterium]